MSDNGKGLYVPGKDGSFKFKGTAEPESRPVLTYESDTGVLLLNFNQLFVQYHRRVSDVVVQTRAGVVCGILVMSEALGPEEIQNLLNLEKNHD